MAVNDRLTRVTSGLADLRTLLCAALDDSMEGYAPIAEAVGAPAVSSPAPTRAPAFSSVTNEPAHWLLQASHSHTASAPRATGRHVTLPAVGQRRALDDDTETTRLVALVELAQKGDGEAFGQLYDNYVSTIYRYVYYRVGAHALAEDLTSETFLRALRALASFRWQGRDFGAWLVTIARNLITDHYKSGRFRLEVTTGEMLDHDSAADGPENDVLASLTNEALLGALKELGAEQQECLVLRFLNGLSVAETAKVLGKTDGAIKQLQLRAVRNLAKLLPEDVR